MSNQPADWQVMNNEVETSTFDTYQPAGWFKIHYSTFKTPCMGLNLIALERPCDDGKGHIHSFRSASGPYIFDCLKTVK